MHRGEKYERWRDKKTGVHPFLPSQKAKGNSAITKYLIGPILVLFRLPAIVTVACILYVGLWLSILIPPIFGLRRMFVRVLSVVCCRLILLLMGFWSITTSYTNFPSRTQPPPLPSIRGWNIAPGDVIFCNRTSYVELLYLSFRFSPEFVVPPTQWTEVAGEPSGYGKRLSLFSALIDYVSNQARTVNDCEKFDQILAQTQHAPLVLLPEGTNSNGEGLLQYIDIVGNDCKHSPSRTHALVFSYTFTKFSPCFSAGSWFWHLIRLCSQFSNTMKVKYVAPHYINPTQSENWEDQSITDWGRAVWNSSVSRALGSAPQTSMNPMHKRQFQEFWDAGGVLTTHQKQT